MNTTPKTKQQKISFYTQPHFIKKTMADLKIMEDRTALVLAKFPEVRDNDSLLALRYWVETGDLPENLAILLKNYTLTNPYDVIRARKKIQNELKLFRASPEVSKKRQVKQLACHSYYGNHTD